MTPSTMAQRIQDEQGFLIVGSRHREKRKRGDVLPGLNAGGLGHLHCSTVVVGDAMKEEFQAQHLKYRGVPAVGEYDFYYKVIAE